MASCAQLTPKGLKLENRAWRKALDVALAPLKSAVSISLPQGGCISKPGVAQRTPGWIVPQQNLPRRGCIADPAPDETPAGYCEILIRNLG
jgi:hypothetical protein